MNHPHKFYSVPERSLVSPLDLHALHKSKDVIIAKSTSVKANLGFATSVDLDFNLWLPFAAKAMNISRDPLDYIMVPVVTIISDLPNRNGLGFPLRELVRWNLDYGTQAYRTFKGKPVYVEHQNDNPLESIGVIADVTLHPLEGFYGKMWKVVKLLAIDRSRNPTIASSVLSGTANSYSMGAYVGQYQCSICGAQFKPDVWEEPTEGAPSSAPRILKARGQACRHLNARAKVNFSLYEEEGQPTRLAHLTGIDISGFETSVVADPAYRSAISDTILPFM